MRDIASHIYDIAENSVNADASLVQISMVISMDRFTFKIGDDGCGMEADMLEKVKDPFVTTRLTRKVGLGIPLLIQNTEQTGGFVNIESKLGIGTKVKAQFYTNHIDCPPNGSLDDVVVNLAVGYPKKEFVVNFKKGQREYQFDTREVKHALQDVSIQDLKVVEYLKAMVRENFEYVLGWIEE